MIVTALTWLCVILVAMLAIGFVTAGIFVVVMLVTTKDRNRELVITFAVLGLLCMAVGFGLVFAALAIGRNLI